MPGQRLVFRLHAIQRMFERHISEAEVHVALAHGEVIEDYPKDTPYPSQLVLGWCGARPLHIVIASDAEDREGIIITVDEPDPCQWEPGFRRRKT
jgi:hypothetical protein